MNARPNLAIATLALAAFQTRASAVGGFTTRVLATQLATPVVTEMSAAAGSARDASEAFVMNSLAPRWIPLTPARAADVSANDFASESFVARVLNPGK